MRTTLIGLVGLIIPLVGCARVQTFRVIDAQTGQPIQGVLAERVADVGRSDNSALPETLTLPVEVSSTNEAGIATFRGSAQQFSLAKAGYDRAEVRSTLSGIQVRYDGTGQEIPIERVEGIAHIPLRKSTTAVQSLPAMTGPASKGTEAVARQSSGRLQ